MGNRNEVGKKETENWETCSIRQKFLISTDQAQAGRYRGGARGTVHPQTLVGFHARPMNIYFMYWFAGVCVSAGGHVGRVLCGY